MNNLIKYLSFAFFLLTSTTASAIEPATYNLGDKLFYKAAIHGRYGEIIFLSARVDDTYFIAYSSTEGLVSYPLKVGQKLQIVSQLDSPATLDGVTRKIYNITIESIGKNGKLSIRFEVR